MAKAKTPREKNIAALASEAAAPFSFEDNAKDKASRSSSPVPMHMSATTKPNRFRIDVSLLDCLSIFALSSRIADDF